MRLLTLSTAVLALAAAPVLAGPDRAGMRGMMMPAFDFTAADADGDGQVTREEFAAYATARIDAARGAMFEARAAELMEAGDTDGDGQLSIEELRAGLETVHAARMEARGEARGDWRERRAERREDRAECRGDRGEQPGRGYGRHGMRDAMDDDRRAAVIERMFDRIDANDDGVINAEEFAAAEARWQERMERRGERRAD